MPVTKPIVSVENVVASASVDQKIDLNDITKALKWIGVTIDTLKDWGWMPKHLKDIFELDEIVGAGYTLEKMKVAFTLGELKDKYDLVNLVPHFTVRDFKSNYTIQQFKHSLELQIRNKSIPPNESF